jgi:hypothetical protein
MMMQLAKDRQGTECFREPAPLSIAAPRWLTRDAFGHQDSSARMGRAYDADIARRTRSHNQGTRVRSTRSVIQRVRSASMIAARSVCRECSSANASAQDCSVDLIAIACKAFWSRLESNDSGNLPVQSTRRRRQIVCPKARQRSAQDRALEER